MNIKPKPIATLFKTCYSNIMNFFYNILDNILLELSNTTTNKNYYDYLFKNID